ncbi:MAG: ATPase domain-containing protein [Myxococcota bacterium]
MPTPTLVVPPRFQTGITGFDLITEGGLPLGRTTLVAGTAGGKTVLAIQMLVRAAEQGAGGVFVLSGGPDRSHRERGIVRLRPAAPHRRGAASPSSTRRTIRARSWSRSVASRPVSALFARIESAAKRVGAKVAVIDSVGAIFPQFSDPNLVRRELHRIAHGLRQLGITTLMTVERIEEQGPVARFGVEEFVADNVIILRNALELEKRRRTIEILKFRGCTHTRRASTRSRSIRPMPSR